MNISSEQAVSRSASPVEGRTELSLIRDYLAQHEYFSELDAAQLDWVARLATLHRLSRGQILSLEGDPCSTVYFVVEGRVRAIKMSPQGREQVVNELQPGQAFYMVPALDGGPLPVTTQGATRATLVGFSCRDFVALLRRYPSIMMHVLGEFARRLRRLTSLIEDLALRSVSGRLARLLIERAKSASHRMTQREMAAQLGTVREVVARSLAQFERQGWIHVRRGLIEIVDPDALRRAAE